jgi:hypothetical protein
VDFRQAYCRMTSLYPKDYQFRFAAEMSKAFAAMADEYLNLGRAGFTRFLVVETAGLLWGAASEWVSKWITDPSVRSRHLPDLRMMPLPWVPKEARLRCLTRNSC